MARETVLFGERAMGAGGSMFGHRAPPGINDPDQTDAGFEIVGDLATNLG